MQYLVGFEIGGGYITPPLLVLCYYLFGANLRLEDL